MNNTRGEVRMTDAEQECSIIEGLEYCKNKRRYDKSCAKCPYAGLGCAIDAAIVKLKAQEQRVMTLEEVQVSINPVWLEGGIAGGTWAMMPITREYSIEFVANGVYTIYPAFAISEYGKTWRCWTSRPTDAQREATSWN